MDLSTGFYYSLQRWGTSPLAWASTAWVKWASLAGEPGGLLMGKWWPEPQRELTEEYGELQKPAQAVSARFDVKAVKVPRANFNPTSNTLTVKQGKTFKLGFVWVNAAGAHVAAMRWVHEGWGNMRVPPPIREGGFALKSAAVVNLPQPGKDLVVYRFEIPAGFPPGRYRIICSPWRGEDRFNQGEEIQFPFTLEVVGSTPGSFSSEMAGTDLYPVTCRPINSITSADWFYAKSTIEGYRITLDTSMAFFYATPGAKAGHYRLTVKGEGEPMISKATPELVWPRVQIAVPPQPEQPVAEVAVQSADTGYFSVEFDAPHDFDSLILTPKLDYGWQRRPAWLFNFRPDSYDQNTLTLRGVRLEALPGNSQPTAAAEKPAGIHSGS